MRARLEEAVAIARRVDPDTLVIVTLRVPRAPVVALISPRFAWQPPEGPQLSGWGEAARVDASGPSRLESVRDAARGIFERIVEVRGDDAVGAPNPRLFGGVAFRPEVERPAPWSAFSDASFVLPQVRFASDGDTTWLSLAMQASEARETGRLDRLAARALEIAERRRSVPDPASRTARVESAAARRWDDVVRDALGRIEERIFEKVVPMTVCRVFADHELDPSCALACLASKYPTCTRFMFQRQSAVFLGASPETLVELAAGVARADALAGTAPRGRGDDESACAALLASDKDRREHATVVQAIASALGPMARRLDVPSAPRTKTLRNVHHLFTPIAAELGDRVHVLDLVQRLHPTPAVAGAPREQALAWLASREPESRGWYSGAVGWFDAKGEGAFAVAIRSGVVVGDRAWLYAGAGIVRGSDPSREYAETRAKHAPMLDALGVVP